VSDNLDVEAAIATYRFKRERKVSAADALNKASDAYTKANAAYDQAVAEEAVARNQMLSVINGDQP